MIGWIISGIIAASVIAAFWDEITDFFKETLNYIKQIIKEKIDESRTFVKKIRNKIKVFIRHYFKKNGDYYYYYEYEKEVDESEVPEDIKCKVQQNEEVEITDSLELYM